MRFLDKFIAPIVSPPAFGLDISDYSIKFVKLSRSSRDYLDFEMFGEIALQEGIVSGGEIKKETDLAQVLKKGLIGQAGKHVNSRFVVATLPEEKSFVHLIQLPKVKAEEVGKAIRWELEGIVPLSVEELYFDYMIMPQERSILDHLDILVTAFPKVVVDSYARVLEQAGLIPIALELESQAIARALWNHRLHGACIFIDFGTTRTSFIIISEETILFTLSAPLGGRDLERAVKTKLNISNDEARRIKMEIGLSKIADQREVYEALTPMISALGDELKKQILFYREHTEHRHESIQKDISTVILSGGDANLIGLTEYLGVILKKEVRVGNPLHRFLEDKTFIPPFSKSQSLQYTGAIGAALRGIGF